MISERLDGLRTTSLVGCWSDRATAETERPTVTHHDTPHKQPSSDHRKIKAIFSIINEPYCYILRQHTTGHPNVDTLELPSTIKTRAVTSK